MYVTEDTSRCDPAMVKRLYSTAINCGARAIVICDTAGHATPMGAFALVRFVLEEVVKPSGEKIRVEGEIAERTKRPGVAVGLAWTPTGGDILFVEANKMKGKGGFTMTGQLGQVMQESMQAALTWVRSNAPKLSISEDWFKDHDCWYTNLAYFSDSLPIGVRTSRNLVASSAVGFCGGSWLAN